MCRIYKCLKEAEFVRNDYKLVSIRDEDKYAIMQWRNEQINVLRQKSFLTREAQESYFLNVVDKLFEKESPEQLLFSFLENGQLVGYGGLVHIDWEKKTGEISFLTKTERTFSKEQFTKDWVSYLDILKGIAESELRFHKIFTYAYDLRPHLYEALLKSGFIEEARLKDEVIIKDKAYDVLIHACYFDELSFRMATEEDAVLYFNWANDALVRKNSYDQNEITFEQHLKWFNQKLESGTCFFYLFMMEGEAAGQVRIEIKEAETVIGISIDGRYRGKGLGKKMLKLASDDFLIKFPDQKINAYIKESNAASYKIFTEAGFSNQEKVHVHNEPSYKLRRIKA